MSIKGKIYAKYLKRAKYVVKGKRLKTPIATIQKKAVKQQSSNSKGFEHSNIQMSNVNPHLSASNNIGNNDVMNNNRSSANAVNNPAPRVSQGGGTNMMYNVSANMSSLQSDQNEKIPSISSNNVKDRSNNKSDISFAEMGKKIVDGDDETRNEKSDSKMLFFVCAALALIIIVGVVQVGKIVFKAESKQQTEVVSSKDDLSGDLDDYMSDSKDDSDVPTPTSIPEEIEELLEEAIAEEEKKTGEKIDKEKVIQEFKDAMAGKTTTDSNKKTNSTLQDILKDDSNSDLNDFLDKNKVTPTPATNTPNNPTQAPATATPPDSIVTQPPVATKPPTSGMDDYVVLCSGDTNSKVYCVKGNYKVAVEDLDKYYYNARIDNGSIKVPKSAINSLWVVKNGESTYKTAYSNGANLNVYTVKVYDFKEGEYKETKSYYVAHGKKLELGDKKYSMIKGVDEEKGFDTFTINGDTDLYRCIDD